MTKKWNAFEEKEYQRVKANFDAIEEKRAVAVLDIENLVARIPCVEAYGRSSVAQFLLNNAESVRDILLPFDSGERHAEAK